MLPFFWYMLKVIICSGILFGYYWLFLRNKIFHRYNRFYLLAAMLLSLLLPVLKINFWQPAAEPNQAIRVLQAVSAGDEYMNTMVITAQKSNWSFEQLYPIIYLFVSFIFLFLMIRTLYLIHTLLKRYPVQQIEQVSFVNTEDDSTPFSFLKYIFWNSSIDMGTITGRQIFKHEVAHIEEKHTHDKLFVNIILIFCWCNPFFWLYRKELNMIHEFIADKKAVEDSNTAAFAAMILQAAYPKHRFELTNNFFYSPIKRRLMMLTKNKNPRVNYFGRIMVLPLAVLIFAAFTFKAKTNSSLYHGKKITVVIDAGHGGQDLGASSADGILEKDITLAIAKKVKELNNNDAVEIVLVRDRDVYMNPQQKVEFAKSKNADLVISLHVDSGPKEQANTKTGMSVFVAKNEFANAAESKVLASAIVSEFSNNYGLAVTSQPIQRQAGVWILQANTCPAVLIEAGFINNDKDLAYLQTPAAKETIAKNVLTAIEKFAISRAVNKTVQNKISNADTSPYSIYVNTKHADSNYLKTDEFKTKALVIVDSKEIGNVGNNYVERSAEKYSTVVIYNTKEALVQFGVKGKYGVIKLTQKDATFITADAVSYDEKTKSIKVSGADASIKGDLSNSLIYLEHKIISPEEVNKIPTAKISSISILKGDKIDDIVDAKGKSSVIYISLKAADLPEVVIKSKLVQNEKTNIKLEPDEKRKNLPENVLYILNGKQTDWLIAKSIKPENIQDIRTIKPDIALQVYGEKGKNGVIIINTKPDMAPVNWKADKITMNSKYAIDPNSKPIIIVDNKEYPGMSLDDIALFTGKNQFKTVDIYGREEAVKMYGERAKDGAVIVVTKNLTDEKSTNDLNANTNVTDAVINNKEKQPASDNKIFIKAEVSPQFTGGDEAWRKYLMANLKPNTPVDEGWKAGVFKVIVKFIVHTDGSVSDVTTENYKGSKTAQHCIDVLKNAPKWQPAIQNGRKVNAYHKQPVTFVIEE